jgi:hypothetical protein
VTRGDGLFDHGPILLRDLIHLVNIGVEFLRTDRLLIAARRDFGDAGEDSMQAPGLLAGGGDQQLDPLGRLGRTPGQRLDIGGRDGRAPPAPAALSPALKARAWFGKRFRR